MYFNPISLLIWNLTIFLSCVCFSIENAFPIENGCNDQYERATATLCIRVSSYPETYEDAQARCNLEGGQLLQDTTIDIHVKTFFAYSTNNLMIH